MAPRVIGSSHALGCGVANLSLARIRLEDRLAREHRARRAFDVLDRQRVLTTIVDLYGGSGAAVRIIPDPSRWPDNEGADRLALPVWFAALTLEHSAGSIAARIRHRIMALATALVEDTSESSLERTWPEFVADRRLVTPSQIGQPRVTVALTRTSSRLAPSVVDDLPGPLSLAAATAAASGVALEDHDESARLSAALALEGLLMTHRHPQTREGSTGEAVAGALRYAVRRLEEAEQHVPPDLRTAHSIWR